MEKKELRTFIEKVIVKLEELIPQHMDHPTDKAIANGNVAVCIIEKDGTIHGKMFGTNSIRARESFRVAWTKASQVWITGMKTMHYEKLFFNNEIDGEKYGIEAPDLIGWEGGQPVTLKDGTTLSVGFSGFRGVVDIDIILKAVEMIEGK